MTKVLLTGFEPFGVVSTNPSQLIVEHFAQQQNPNIITEVLPVAYAEASIRIKELLQAHRPDVFIMLGVAEKREYISLERIAVNINDAGIADNTGKHLTGKRIIEDAPVGYWSTLPFEAMYDAIAEADIKVKYSNHAGAYLCNHVFYMARHTLETIGRAVPCGFIHVPGIKVMPIEQQIQAIEICVDVVMSMKVING